MKNSKSYSLVPKSLFRGIHSIQQIVNCLHFFIVLPLLDGTHGMPLSLLCLFFPSRHVRSKCLITDRSRVPGWHAVFPGHRRSAPASIPFP